MNVGCILMVLGGLGALLFSAKADEKKVHDPKRIRYAGIALVCAIILVIGLVIRAKS